MDNYALRTAIRDWEREEGERDLEFPFRDEIEQKLFELDRINQLVHNYRAVLRDVLK